MSTVLNEGDVFLVRVEYRDLQDHVAYNVLHYRLREINPPGGTLYVPQPTYDVAPPLAQRIAERWALNWKPFGSNRCRVTGAMAQSIAPGPKSAGYTYVLPAGDGDGLVIDDMLPMQDAVTILKRTALGSRSGLGRVFVPGIPEQYQASGVIDIDGAGFLVPLASEIKSLQSVTVTGTEYLFEPVLAKKVGPDNYLTTPIIEAHLSDRIIKTQRRRRPGKGI